MSEDPVAGWHAFVARRDPALLDALLADDVVFRSPAVHRSQEGRAVTARYLTAAMQVLGTADFRYTGEWRTERSVVLEFRTELDGLEVHGIDMIDWDEDGRIAAFTVMVRPLKALNAVVAHMAAALA
ncbi:nuclear transport factor 2 family protein [Sphingomonas rubra]|uniref:SnoaL-like domain-containing protein n=1 Tax=Sphingomonas rubra TaxID=634430 RepID=A0A1I5RSM6_9SPHN|nr:nuclear transport factor 2 family protein [Sphingomonas rubra]SFP61380.1 SnoaL-like domain-containing protein [Sphingomonas rubra]